MLHHSESDANVEMKPILASFNVRAQRNAEQALHHPYCKPCFSTCLLALQNPILVLYDNVLYDNNNGRHDYMTTCTCAKCA